MVKKIKYRLEEIIKFHFSFEIKKIVINSKENIERKTEFKFLEPRL